LSVEVTAEGRYLLDFDTAELPRREADVLVIGGGIAGLNVALEAGRHGKVLLLTKDEAALCNTAWAQGGIAAAIGAGDSPGEHAEDTIRTGCGLADEDVVHRVMDEAPAAVERLVALGTRFDRDDGAFALGQEGGHGRRRVLHRGDATGLEIIRALLEAARRSADVERIERQFVVDLLTEGGRCVGALALTREGNLTAILSKAVVIASGGVGRLFRETTNVRGATGDGIAAAYRAGAVLKDLEFVQFHPTTLYLAGSDRVLVTEAVRGEGAYLVDNEGRRFLKGVHPAAELAPRDVVSRAIVDHLANPGVTGVFLDMRHWPEGRAARFPGLVDSCLKYGLDPTRDLIPVRPAAHYFIGGVRCDIDGATGLRGLYACGEAGCSGLHGANRLASNSLLEGLVLGARAGRAAAAYAASAGTPGGRVRHATGRTLLERDVDVDDLRKSLLSCMWRLVGMVRDGSDLEEAAQSIDRWRVFSAKGRYRRRAALELENLLLLGALVTAAAGLRRESRGTHGRRDFPRRDDEHFLGSFVWSPGSVSFEPKGVPTLG
jgi:L-aspartate oxidase